MCQNKTNNANTMTIKSNKKLSYSVKKLLQKIFKQQQQQVEQEEEQNLKNTLKANSLESLESIENSLNASLECASLESFDNEANERLSQSCDLEDYDLEQLPTVPVHFVRTAHGTFFWTAVSDLPADNDLVQPLGCSTANELAVAQFQDRWVQA